MVPMLLLPDPARSHGCFCWVLVHLDVNSHDSHLDISGSSVTTLGLVWRSLAAMWLGRFLFWLGLNVLLMVQTILVYDLFKGDTSR